MINKNTQKSDVPGIVFDTLISAYFSKSTENQYFFIDLNEFP